jgi:hypothetical protein
MIGGSGLGALLDPARPPLPLREPGVIRGRPVEVGAEAAQRPQKIPSCPLRRPAGLAYGLARPSTANAVARVHGLGAAARDQGELMPGGARTP